MHRRVAVELLHERQQLYLARRLGEIVLQRVEATFLRRLALGADIDLARWISAGQHDGEAGGDAPRDEGLAPRRQRRRASRAETALPSMRKGANSASLQLRDRRPASGGAAARAIAAEAGIFHARIQASVTKIGQRAGRARMPGLCAAGAASMRVRRAETGDA